jgi:hypothetical protein
MDGYPTCMNINLARNPRMNILLSEFRIQNQRFQNSKPKVSEFKIKGFRIQFQDTSDPAVPHDMTEILLKVALNTINLNQR